MKLYLKYNGTSLVPPVYDRTSGPIGFGGSGVKGDRFNNVSRAKGVSVGPLSKSLLLFTLNWLDGQLTVLWVRLDVASEGNGIMNRLLSLGDAPFLSVKLVIGAFAAYVLYRCAHLPIARRGMKLVLVIYSILLFVHVATGFAALGWQAPHAVLTYFGSLPSALLAFLS